MYVCVYVYVYGKNDLAEVSKNLVTGD